ATVVHHATGHLVGRPAITRSEHGAGSAYYVSTRLDADSLAGLLASLCHAAGVEPVVAGVLPTGVEVVRRRGADHTFLFVLNHGTVAVQVTGPGDDLVSGAPTGQGILVTAGSVAVIREGAGAARAWTIEREG
ncbi:MAG: hypothetical protein HGA44_12575, partial [Cellulomonadaceae bacterium]|nr:hypothetical protein [Cellulomonadaceae bacterium]